MQPSSIEQALGLPKYLIDQETHQRDIQFGEVATSFKKVDGRVAAITLTTTDSKRFPDNKLAVLYIIDQIKTLPTDKSGKITLELEYKNGTVVAAKKTVEQRINYDATKDVV